MSLQVAQSLSVLPEQIESITLADLDENFSRPRNTSMVCRRLGEEAVGDFMTLERAMKVIKEGP